MKTIRSLTIIACLVGGISSVIADGLTSREEFFENEVRPLLIEKCQQCHDSSLQESDLRLDGLAFILQGGLSGPAAIERNIDDSLIIHAITGTNGLERMPPDEPLAAAEIAILKKWVRIGLPWTASDEPAAPSLGDQVAIGQAAESHWAFQPIDRPSVPSIDSTNSSPARNPIDVFITQTLADNDLTMNPPADRRVLVRRLYFDLVGLPPMSDEVDAIVNDDRDDDEVLDELTTRLLASEHHGERWARYWLDLARYADTRDWQAQAELRYPYAYTYRDYVIESLNADKPYDQFIREQVAADFYTDDPNSPQLAAMGLMTVGPRFRNDRLEQAADKIDVVCRGLMGITVACARCHDHKYDPVPIEDYYSLYGVFASSDTPDEYPIISGGDSSDDDLRRDFERQVELKRRDLSQYKQSLRRDAVADLRNNLPKYIDGFMLMQFGKKLDIRGTISKLGVKETAMTPLKDILAAQLNDKSLADHPVLGPWITGLSVNEADFKRDREAWLEKWTTDNDLNPSLRTALQANPPTKQAELAAVYADVFDKFLKRFQKLQAADGTASSMPNPDDEAIRKVLLDPGGWFALNPEKVAAASRLLGKGRKELGDREKAITEVEVTHPGAPPKAMTLVDLDRPITPFVLLRGEQARRGERVPRQFLSIIEGEDRVPFSKGSGRGELAEAIVSPTNPLTPRVLVNRVWARYFGAGLVTSLDDFGLRSDPPSHPELLDWLAGQFIDNGWSMKWLHRVITESRTYRQASVMRDDGYRIDPENRLLWRQNRRRLDFEAMRDSMLAVAGSLDQTVGGRSVRLSEEPFPNRRSVYAYIDRIELDAMLRTFDFASPSAPAASRAETIIPQQALFGMNHPFVVQLCKMIADDCASDRKLDEQIRSVYSRVIGRLPSDDELSATVAFIESANSASQTIAPDWQYGYGEVDRSSDNDAGSFTPLKHWTGAAYQASDLFPDPEMKHIRLTATTVHPHIDENSGAIRRWTAPAGGIVSVAGTVKHTRENSDGIIVIVRWPGDSLSVQVAQSTAKTDMPRIKIRRGDVIDFISSPGPTPTADSHSWTIRIVGVGGDAKGRVWDSAKDFQPPPAPPLTPLAQVAQALMLTNEFLYLD